MTSLLTTIVNREWKIFSRDGPRTIIYWYGKEKHIFFLPHSVYQINQSIIDLHIKVKTIKLLGRKKKTGEYFHNLRVAKISWYSKQ